MTTAFYATPANAATADTLSRTGGLPLQWAVGFFFAFRFCLTFIGFQSNPRAGTVVNLLCSVLLLSAGLVYTLGDEQFSMRLLLASRTMRWLFAYLAVSGMSLLWTGAGSPGVAAGYWAGMAMDVATVLLVVKGPRVSVQVDALMKGFVWGAMVIAAVAWASPTMPDLRIGDAEFMHPNGLGLYCALGFFLAQHLALKERAWRWCCVALGITLLRSISKTSIVAFLIAETFYLLREKQISTWMKVKVAAGAGIVFAAFGTLLQAYFAIYSTTGAGDQAETLTGRTLIWATSLSMAMERPWIGHGIYSFRTLIPAFGTFEPWHAHNELLQQFFELGLLGAVVTVCLYFSLMMAARRTAARRYGNLSLAIVVFAAIRGLADTFNFGLSLPLWLFAAFAMVLMQDAQKAEQ
jgi:exopolysaccharide production protein ExoQ